jgi:hypothetical protein
MSEKEAKAEAVRYWWEKALASLEAAGRELEAEDGGVVDLDFVGSHGETKLITIDKQTNDSVVHRGRLGKADRLVRAPLDARAPRHLLPFNPLRIAFARDRHCGEQMPGVRSPVISEEAGDAKGLQQGFKL